MNINLDMALNIQLIQCANAVLKQKQHSTFSCVAGCILLLEQNSWTIASSLTNYPDKKHLSILLYGSQYFSVKTNQSILVLR